MPTLHRLLLERKIEEILGGLEPVSVFLDLGGVGRYNAHVKATRIVTLDLQPKHKPHVLADGHCLPLRDECCDLILSTEVLEHCADPWKVVDEAHRVLKKGGRIVLTTPLIYELHGSPCDYFRFTHHALEMLFKNFHEATVHAQGNRLSAAWDLVFRWDTLVSRFINPWVYGWMGKTRTDGPSAYVVEARK